MNPVEYLNTTFHHLESNVAFDVNKFTRTYYADTGDVITLTDDTFLCYVMSTDAYIHGLIYIYRDEHLTKVMKRDE